MNAVESHPHLIDIDELPESLRDLTDIIGLESTLKLATLFPGVPLYIPSHSRADHPIATVIGEEKFSKLVYYYEGDTIKLAKIDAVDRQIRHKRVRILKERGMTNREIAIELKYSQRHIERLVSKMNLNDRYISRIK